MRRKITEELLKWKQKDHGRTALLVEGARRVGKSYIVEEFGREYYKSCILIDFMAAGPQDEQDMVPVVRVQDYQVWRTQLSAAGTSLKPGNKVTLETDGLRVTATTTCVGAATAVSSPPGCKEEKR